nr:hypothetical protein [Tanacetum cinerariifolium]
YSSKTFDLENEVKILKNVDHSLAIRATIKFEVPTIVKEYLRTSLDDTLHKVIQRHTAKLIKEYSVLADVVEVPQQQQNPHKTTTDIHKIKMEQAGKQNETKYTITLSETTKLQEFDQKRTLFETMTKTKNEGPLAGPDQGLKRKKTGKDTKPSKKAKSYVELRYNMEEYYKALNDQLDWNNLEGVIYLDKLERNRLMCSYELYKFSDSTLISVQDKLKDILNNLEMGYTSVMLRRRWSNLDKKRSCIKVKAIDRQLLERRLMRSLEKFVCGREYGEDLRLLQRTI